VDDSQHGGPEAPPREGLDVVRVHAMLRSLILDCTLEPGRRVSQSELSRLTGAGRTPLREALRMLQQEGLVTSEANRGVTIAPFDLDELDCLYAYRVSLESAAIRITVPLLTRGDYAQLEQAVSDMTAAVESGDSDEFEDPHRRFHQLLVGHVQKPARARMARDAEKSERFRRLMIHTDQQVTVTSEREHREILDACIRRDDITASHLLANHLARSAIYVAAELDPTYAPVLTRMAIRTVVGTDTTGTRGETW